MKHKLLLATFFVCCSFLSFSSTYTFSGTGNWNDANNWIPNMPNTKAPLNTYNFDTIQIDGNCTTQITDTFMLNLNTTYIINGSFTNNCNYDNNYIMGSFIINKSGTFINNGVFNLSYNYLATNGFPENYFINHGNIQNNGTLNLQPIYNQVINNGSFINSSNIFCKGEIINNGYIKNDKSWVTQSEFEYYDFDSMKYIFVTLNANITNNGTIHNYDYFESEGGIYNYGKINSYTGTMNSFGRNFFNYDTIIGNLTTNALSNTGFLSPGFNAWDTDTMKFLMYGLSGNEGQMLIEINNNNDYDVLVLEYGENITNILSFMTITINPNYTPTITDTFHIVKVLNNGSAPFKLSNKTRNTFNLPPAPSGYAWKLVQLQNEVILTLNIALPIQPSSMFITAKKRNDWVDLKWNLTELQNTTYFEIEHSSDAKNYASIGKVNCTNSLQYAFTHTQPNKFINYYRLKAFDVDGQFSTSNPISLVFENENELIFVENNLLHIQSNNIQTISLYNSLGQQLVKNEIQLGLHTIDISNYPRGIYFLTTENKTYKLNW